MAYEKKIPVDLDCPLRLTMSLIESKWKSCLLDELRDGNGYRPSELHKCLPEATPRVLDIQLKEMAEDGLVVKTIFPELPPRSEYRITPLGASLLPIIDAMLRWGEEHFDVFEKKYGNPGGNSTCSKSIK
ncbi:helix-turn-helix domain-containing protein [uncultured Duncaniella sp.]|jgi:DNA-binding HxlR family transcriptional regulator|uniref:winged helix-turn-helix transcriptional regulator n=1 Tax=uncultured Duncaniella sp. TaxID=2768039 RepID=UPI0026748AB1|nr:helix-turn-helix domain-containing protein [uncultured Duncaniella sp.]